MFYKVYPDPRVYLSPFWFSLFSHSGLRQKGNSFFRRRDIKRGWVVVVVRSRAQISDCDEHPFAVFRLFRHFCKFWNMFLFTCQSIDHFFHNFGQCRHLFLLFSSFSHSNCKVNDTGSKKHRWCAWDSNPGRRLVGASVIRKNHQMSTKVA